MDGWMDEWMDAYF